MVYVIHLQMTQKSKHIVVDSMPLIEHCINEVLIKRLNSDKIEWFLML